MDRESYIENLKDRVLQSSFAEWAALVSVNGLILTAGSIAMAMKPGCPAWIAFLLFSCNIGSSIIILCNMRFLRGSYEKAYGQTQKDKPDVDYRYDVTNKIYAMRRRYYFRLRVVADVLLGFSLLVLLRILTAY